MKLSVRSWGVVAMSQFGRSCVHCRRRYSALQSTFKLNSSRVSLYMPGPVWRLSAVVVSNLRSPCQFSVAMQSALTSLLLDTITTRRTLMQVEA
ncbi:hypothetical protein C8R48DRAFT_733342 [Suillus tomentosus]|nr:hypothetical protein C8R48DRAFT_733342 [Suillus tomentosus]